jgi:transcriptional regulator with XRE-family HTH domain
MYNHQYAMVLAEERAIASVQAMAIRLLDEKKLKRSELAKSLEVSEARISQIFAGDPANLSIKKAAQLFFAMGEELVFSCKKIDEMNVRASKRHREIALMTKLGRKANTWTMKPSQLPANNFEDDHYPLRACA